MASQQETSKLQVQTYSYSAESAPGWGVSGCPYHECHMCHVSRGVTEAELKHPNAGVERKDHEKWVVQLAELVPTLNNCMILDLNVFECI